MPLLRAISGPHSGEQFHITGPTIEVGRDPGCGVLLPRDTGVSRRHLALEFQASQITARDLGSRNGFFVNGARTIGTILKPGDRIQVGESILELEPDAPASTVAPAPGFQNSPPIPAGYGAPVAISAGGQSAAAYPAPAGYSPPAGYAPPVYEGAPASRSVPAAKWLYLLCFIIPPAGIIIGLIYLLKETPEEQRVGKWCIFWGILNTLLTWWSVVVLMKLLAHLTSQLGPGGLQGLMGGQSGDPTGALR